MWMYWVKHASPEPAMARYSCQHDGRTAQDSMAHALRDAVQLMVDALSCTSTHGPTTARLQHQLSCGAPQQLSSAAFDESGRHHLTTRCHWVRSLGTPRTC